MEVQAGAGLQLPDDVRQGPGHVLRPAGGRRPHEERIHHHHEEVRLGEDCGEKAVVCDRLLPTRFHWKDVQIRGAAMACQFLPHVLQR